MLASAAEVEGSAAADLNGSGGIVNGDEGIVRARTSSDKIDDRRSSPSKADHGHIINSFQQGLVSVETVIVYDNDSLDSDMENDHAMARGGRSMLAYRFLVQLGGACAWICGCHHGIADLAGAWRHRL